MGYLGENSIKVFKSQDTGTAAVAQCVTLDFYYDERSMLLGFRYNGEDYWYLRNAQSDITGILDSEGNQVVSYTYDSWGVPQSVTGSMAETIGQLNPFRYRGYYYDAELGLYYLNSRYYDPATGRFINLDCYIMAGNSLLGGNMYLYCNNNPIRRIDSSGSSFFDSPLSTAALAAMSPSMIKEYNTARAKYLASVTSQGNRNVQQTSLPKTGKPNSKETLPNPDGTPKQERWYGPNGEPVRDRDYNHGGNHEFPHDHEWNNGVRGPAIPVPQTEISYADVGTGVMIGVGAVGVGYLIYRGVRMLPSLLPPLWWTIPANAVIP